MIVTATELELRRRLRAARTLAEALDVAEATLALHSPENAAAIAAIGLEAVERAADIVSRRAR